MKINWKVIDEFLIGESETDDIPDFTKKEISEFLSTHDLSVFSDESLKILAGIWDLAYKSEYEGITGDKIPNIFYRLDIKEEENE